MVTLHRLARIQALLGRHAEGPQRGPVEQHGAQARRLVGRCLREQAAAVDVELRYPAHGTSFAAHDGTAPEPEPDVPCAYADGASARQATATAAAAARRRAVLCCIVCSVQLGE